MPIRRISAGRCGRDRPWRPSPLAARASSLRHRGNGHRVDVFDEAADRELGRAGSAATSVSSGGDGRCLAGGPGAGACGDRGGALVCSYFYLPPLGSLAIHVPNDAFRLLVFLVEGSLISTLMESLHGARRKSEASTREAKRYQDVSRRERDFAEGLIATAQAVVLVLDREGRIIRVNPFLERVTGFPRTTSAVRTGSPPSCRRRIGRRAREAFLRALGGSEGCQITHPIVTRDGGERELKWAHRRLKGVGDLPCVIGIGLDITNLKTAQQRALQAERLAAIGEMVAGLVHESRNALHRGQVCLEMLALEVEDRPEALNLIARLQRAQDDLYRLFEDVRSYAAPISWSPASATWRKSGVSRGRTSRPTAGDGRPASRRIQRTGPSLRGRPLPSGAGFSQHPG